MTVTLETLKKKIGKKKKSSVSMVYAWLADLEREAGDIDGSLSCVNEGLQFYVNDLPGVLVRSKIFFEKGEYEACIAECEKALQKDPFCLSAQMRMGKAYEQLGNLPERNKCFRRVHDMDPLDTFWKEEYDDTPAFVPEEEESTEGELDFSMPELADDSLNEGDVGFKLEKSVDADATSADPNAVVPEEESPDAESIGEGMTALFGKALDDALESDEISGEQILSQFLPDEQVQEESNQEESFQVGEPQAEEPVVDQGVAEQSSFEPSSFEKSTESEFFESSAQDENLNIEPTSMAQSISDMPSEQENSSIQTTSFDELLGAATTDIDSPMETDVAATEDTQSSNIESNASSQAMEDDPFAALAELLPGDDEEDNSIMDNLQASLDAVMADLENSSEESSEEIASEENISGGDVSSALFDMFGSDDNLEDVGSGESASPFANLNIPESISEESVAESTPMSSTLDDMDKPLSVDSAFSSIFGDDDLPEELPAAEEKSEEALEVSEESSIESLEEAQPVVEEPAPKKPSVTLDEDKPVSLDSAFASIFGEDELPEENSSSEPAEKSDIDAVFGKSSGLDDLSEESFKAPSSIFDDDDNVDIPTISTASVDDNFTPESAEKESPSLDESSRSATVEFEESSISEKSEEEKSAFDSELEKRMGGAFSNIFGDEDDSLDENAQAASSAEPAKTEVQAEEDPTETIEFVDEPAVETKPQAGIPEKSEEERSAFDSELEKRMGGAFNNDIDDAVAVPSVAAHSVEKANVEVGISEKSEEERSAFDSELEKRMGGAFNNIFGDEDDSVEEKPQEASVTESELQVSAEEVSVAEISEEQDEKFVEKSAENVIAEAVTESAEEMVDAPVEEVTEETVEDSVDAPVEDVAEETISEASVETEKSKDVSSFDSELENQVGGAFSNIFGDDDEFTGVPEKKAEEAVAELAPETEESASEGDTLENQLGGAFSNIFGDDDEFTGAPEKKAEESVENEASETEESSSEGDTLENQLGGAFSNIFGDDDEFTGAPEKPAEESVENEASETEESSSEGDTLENQLGGAFSNIFGDDDDVPESISEDLVASENEAKDTPVEEPSTEESTSAAVEERVIPDDNSLDSEVSGAFKGLFYTGDDAPVEEVAEATASNGKGVDFLMSGDSDDDVSVGLIKDPSKPLDNDVSEIDDSLNTKTLAEIYFEQGLYAKALEIYQDLCGKEPDNTDYQNRMAEIEKIYHEKFGDA